MKGRPVDQGDNSLATIHPELSQPALKNGTQVKDVSSVHSPKHQPPRRGLV
jgi:hypothetical protein